MISTRDATCRASKKCMDGRRKVRKKSEGRGGRTGQFVGQEARPSGEQGHGQGLQIKLGQDGLRGRRGPID